MIGKAPKEALRQLQNLVKAGASAIGIDRQNVVIGADLVAIIGTGMSIEWSSNAFGRNKAGWVLKQVYHSANPLTGESGMAEELVQTIAQDDIFLAAKMALLTIVRRQVEAAMASAVE